MSFKRPQSPNKTLHNLELNMAVTFCPIGIPVSYLFSTVTALEKEKKEKGKERQISLIKEGYIKASKILNEN